MKKYFPTILALVLCVCISTNFARQSKVITIDKKTEKAAVTAPKEIISAQQTFAIIKPDAVEAKNTGKIIDMILQDGFEIKKMEKIQFTADQAKTFYAEHKGKPFFDGLVEFMTSGPVIIMVLEKENAIKDWRKLIGATNPAKADKGTIRQLFGTKIPKNAAHGSDAPESAKREIDLLFFR